MGKDDIEMQAIRNELELLGQRQSVLHKRLRTLHNKGFSARMGKLFPDGEITLARVMAIDWNELGNITYDTPWGKRIRAWITQETHNGSLSGLYPGGISDTNQAGFQILIRKKPRWQRQVGFLVLLPHMKPNEAGAKVMSVFGTSYNTLVKVTDEDTRFIVTNRDIERRLAHDPKDRWAKPIAEFKSGRELLPYLQANYAFGSDDGS